MLIRFEELHKKLVLTFSKVIIQFPKLRTWEEFIAPQNQLKSLDGQKAYVHSKSKTITSDLKENSSESEDNPFNSSKLTKAIICNFSDVRTLNFILNLYSSM